MKIESGKRIIFFIVFAIIGILAVLIYNISVMILFTDEKKVDIDENIYFQFMLIPWILGFLCGMFLIIPLKTWNMISFLYNVNKKVDAVQIQAFLDARCEELGFNPIWMRKEEKGKK